MFRFILGLALLAGAGTTGYYAGRIIERLSDQVFYVVQMHLDSAGDVTGVQYVLLDSNNNLNFVANKEDATPLSIKEAMQTKRFLVSRAEPDPAIQFGLESQSSLMQTA